MATIKERSKLFAEGLHLYAQMMDARIDSPAMRRWEAWQDKNAPLDEKVMDFYCHTLLHHV